MTMIQRSSALLTAADLMTRDVVTVPQHLPASEAAQVLLSKSISGVPVVDDHGRCVGILSATDFTRIAETHSQTQTPPVPCPFQLRHRRVDGDDVTLCTLATGMCPLQRTEDEEGKSRHICGYPHEIVVEWQAIQPACSAADPVQRWMTAEPITVNSSASIRECAARMLHARIHRLIVVDEEQRVVGVLSSTDLLTAIAGSSPDK
jgi:CBS domain-containing protein